jgi:acyl carrier protein
MEDKIKAAFAESLNYSGDLFSGAIGPEDVSGWDSLGHLRLVAALQDQFGIEFEVDEIMRMENVAAIKSVLAERNFT